MEKYEIPMELKTIFKTQVFRKYLDQSLINYNVSYREYFNMYNEVELRNLFMSFIVQEYNTIEEEPLKVLYASSLVNEASVDGKVSYFIHVVCEATRDDETIKQETIRDFTKLMKLRSYASNKYFKDLDSYNCRIMQLLSDGIINHESYKEDLTEEQILDIVTLTKCNLAKAICQNHDIHDTIDALDDIFLEAYLLEAYTIYMNGTRTEEDRKEEREKHFEILTEVNFINMDGWFTRTLK